MIQVLLCCLIAYVIGSIPTGWIITYLVTKKDIRREGSGNIGATNVFRVAGKKWGISCLILDMLKGLIPVLLVKNFITSSIFPSIVFDQVLVAVATIIGHSMSIFLKFMGGKGVATTCGAIMGVFPLAMGSAFLTWFVLVFVTRYVSLASIIAALSYLVWFYLYYKHIDFFIPMLGVSVFVVSLIIFRHKANIGRLVRGEELRFGSKK